MRTSMLLTVGHLRTGKVRRRATFRCHTGAAVSLSVESGQLACICLRWRPRLRWNQTFTVRTIQLSREAKLRAPGVRPPSLARSLAPPLSPSECIPVMRGKGHGAHTNDETHRRISLRRVKWDCVELGSPPPMVTRTLIAIHALGS